MPGPEPEPQQPQLQPELQAEPQTVDCTAPPEATWSVKQLKEAIDSAGGSWSDLSEKSELVARAVSLRQAACGDCGPAPVTDVTGVNWDALKPRQSGVLEDTAPSANTAILTTDALLAQEAADVAKRGDRAKACALWQRAVSQYPTSSVVLCGSASFHLHQGIETENPASFEEAGRLWEQAVAGNPQCVEALGNLGNLYRQMGRMEDAKRTWEKALVINPSDISTLTNLAQFNDELGNLTE
eukprot:SAG31_NODE_1219_length_9302_cov_13.527328_2_plen_241_part_00